MNVWNKTLTLFFIDVLLTLALIKQATSLICDSSGKFQNDLDDQNLMVATVHYLYMLGELWLNRG
jgi:hypothetical protein